MVHFDAVRRNSPKLLPFLFLAAIARADTLSGQISQTLELTIKAAAGSSVTLAAITNGVSQIAASAAEPQTMVLVGTVLLGLTRLARKNLKRRATPDRPDKCYSKPEN